MWNKPKSYLLEVVFCLCITVLFGAMLSSPLVKRFEYVFLDSFFKIRQFSPQSPDIVHIDIAEDSARAVGQFPWPRHYHAVLIHILDQWGAKAILLDMMFQRPGSKVQDDEALSESIQKSGKVYMPVFLDHNQQDDNWSTSLERFQQHAKGVGHVNIEPDADGLLRRITPFLSSGGKTYPHFALKASFDLLGKDLNSDADVLFPKDENGRLIINWAGSWSRTFRHYSYINILRSFQALAQGQPAAITPDKIKGKICVVGMTLAGGTDIKSTPVDTTHPGVGVLGNTINNVLNQNFIHPTNKTTNYWILFFITLLCIRLFIPFHNVFSSISCIIVILAWLSISYGLFQTWNIWTAIANPILLILSLYIFCSIWAKMVSDKEKSYFFHLATRDGLTGLYDRHYFETLLKKDLKEILKDNGSLALLMIDIDHFKQINDTHGHQAGDMVLRGVSQLILASIRNRRATEEVDYAGRYGGEEMTILLKHSNLFDAQHLVAEPLRVKIENETFMWENTPLNVTVSIGLSTVRYKDTLDKLIMRADKALYTAKRNGRNRVCTEND